MCNRPDFEGEEAELDQELVALMRHRRQAEELDGPAWVEQFIQDIQRRAEELQIARSCGTSQQQMTP
jgi:hypothetical protein